jgi:MFS family permease
VAIAGAFVCAGLIEVALAPVAGRLSDVRGRLVPVRLGLWGMAAIGIMLALSDRALVVAALIFCASVAVSGVTSPGIALVSDRAEATGLPQTLGFGVMNSAWATGAMVGPVAAGALAAGVGDATPYLVCAGIAVATAIGIGSTITEPQRA